VSVFEWGVAVGSGVLIVVELWWFLGSRPGR